ncbi:MAG: GC-type dockerin domain-anchored protein [Phycisphaerales bacterium JB039]
MNWIRLATILVCTRGAAVFGQCDTTFLEAPDLTALSYFGKSMAESGGVLMVGAPGSTDAAWPSGRVFEFNHVGGRWQSVSVIDDPGANTRFGHSLSLEGDRLVAGAPYEGPSSKMGAAHIYRRDPAGWTREAVLQAPDGGASDRFGWSVAIAGDTVAVGAPFRREIEDESGAVYFFRRSGVSWRFDGKVVHDTVQWRNYFGYHVRLLNANSCVITAHGADEQRGALMWFVRDGGEWQLRQKITNPDADGLGLALDATGDVLATTGGSFSQQTSAVFLYRFDGAEWSLLHTMTAEFSWRLGREVAIDSGRVLVGAPNTLRSTRRVGQAHLFEYSTSDWRHEAFILADPYRRFENLGESVVFSGGAPLVGAASDARIGPGSGAVAELTLPLVCTCPGDFNRDGISDLFDWLDYLSAFAAGDPRADIDLDGELDSIDFLNFQLDFEAGCWG